MPNLIDKYEKMAKRIRTSSSVDQLLTNTNLSYSTRIMVVPLPLKFKVSAIDMYDRSKDPVEHLETFKTHTTLHGFPGEIACRAFPLTFKGMARG